MNDNSNQSNNDSSQHVVRIIYLAEPTADSREQLLNTFLKRHEQRHEQKLSATDILIQEVGPFTKPELVLAGEIRDGVELLMSDSTNRIDSLVVDAVAPLMEYSYLVELRPLIEVSVRAKRFHILDCAEFEITHLEGMLDLLRIQENYRKQRGAKRARVKRRNHKPSALAVRNSAQKRKLASRLNRQHIAAIAIANNLRDKYDMKYLAIAKYLDKHGYKTIQNKTFKAHNVKEYITQKADIVEKYIANDVFGNYGRNQIIESKLGTLAREVLDKRTLNIQNEGNTVGVDGNLKITYNSPNTAGYNFLVEIYSNDLEELVYSEPNMTTKDINLDLLDKQLLPGRYYLMVKDNEPDSVPLYTDFVYRADLNQLINNVDVEAILDLGRG